MAGFSILQEATIPRNGSGTYTLPEAAFVPGTVISSTAVNSDFSDLGTAMTDSLARNGEGGMLAELPLDPDGFSYTNDPNTGMHRTGADAQAIKCAGTDIVEIDTSGETVNGNLEVTGTITKGGSAILPIGLGPLPWSRVAAPGGWLLVGKLYSRTTYSALWAVAQAEIALGNTFYTIGDGSTTFGVGLDMPGCVPACNDSISGSAAGTLTQAVFGSNPAVVGNTGGAQTHTLTQSELSVALGTATSVVTDPGHVHDANTASGSGGATGYPQMIARAPSVTTDIVLSATTGITVATTITNASGGNAHNNVQPTIITNYIIFAGV